jgi:hypothetical protein
LLDGSLVALAGAAEWFLRAPAGGAQQIADVIEVIPDAELAADHLRHPSCGPDLAAKAEGFCALGQQQRQAGELLGRQPGHWTRRRPVSQAGHPAFPATPHPLTDRALGHAQRSRDVALSPALLA